MSATGTALPFRSRVDPGDLGGLAEEQADIGDQDVGGVADEGDVDGAADAGRRVHEREPGGEGCDRPAARVDAQDPTGLASVTYNARGATSDTR
jgi:hypothetical protein